MSTTDKLAGAIIKKPTASVAAKRMTSKNPIINMLLDPKFKRQMAMALPKSLTADRLTRIVMTEFRKHRHSCDAIRNHFSAQLCNAPLWA